MRRSRTVSVTVVGAGPLVIHGHDDRLGVVLGRGLDFFDIRVGEAGNLLLLAVVGDLELIGAQSLDRLPGTVGDLDIDADNIGLRAENERGVCRRSLPLRRRWRRLLLRGRRNGSEKEAPNRQNSLRATKNTPLDFFSIRTVSNALFTRVFEGF